MDEQKVIDRLCWIASAVILSVPLWIAKVWN